MTAWQKSRVMGKGTGTPTVARSASFGVIKAKKGRPRGRPQGDLPPAACYLKVEVVISLAVMNSSSAGVPSWVFRMPRVIAGMISFGSVIRSP